MTSKEKAIRQAYGEYWEKCSGFESYYEVSNLGNIRSVDRIMHTPNNKKYVHKGRMLRPYKNKYGYQKVSLSCGDIYKTINLHVLIAKTFIKNPQNKPQVNHINGIKTDNRVDNLEWCTREENMQHAHKLGLMNMTSGSNHFMYKIHPSKHPRSRPIINTVTKNVYGSIKEAYVHSGVCESTFRGWILNSFKNEWMYYDEYINNNGWRPIENFNTTKQEGAAYWMMTKKGKIIDTPFRYNEWTNKFDSLIGGVDIELFSHYIPIQLPKDKIY